MSRSYTEHVLVVLETTTNEPSRSSLEAVACAQQLGCDRLSLLILENNNLIISPSISNLRVDEIVVLRHELLKPFNADVWVEALAQAVQKLAPTLVLIPHSYHGRDYAPALASRIERSLVSDCLSIQRDESGLAFIRQMFQGRAQMRLRLRGEAPGLITLQAGSYRIENTQRTEETVKVQDIEIELDPELLRVDAELPYKTEQRTVDLGSAEIIVAVGRGIKGPDHINMARRLADLLGAELAASRPVCDEGWLPMERQVGSSGQTVSPKLYIAIGISGAVQHLVGMKDAETIVAINKDANAPIFKIADYGIVGDLFNILPALIQVLEEKRS